MSKLDEIQTHHLCAFSTGMKFLLGGKFLFRSSRQPNPPATSVAFSPFLFCASLFHSFVLIRNTCWGWVGQLWCSNMQKIVGSKSKRCSALQGMLIRNCKVYVPERKHHSISIGGKQWKNMTWQHRSFIYNTIFLAEMRDPGCAQTGKFGITVGL